MKTKLLLVVGLLSCVGGVVMAEEGRDRVVRVAELEIDPAQAEVFATAIPEVGQASVRSEDGCLVLYAVAEKNDPGRVRVFEAYRDSAAYEARLLTPHFRKFPAVTDAMVKSRRRIDATPLSLATKPGVTPRRLRALLAALLGLVPGAHATALTCTELAGRAFGNARILETQDVSGRLPLGTMCGGSVQLEGPLCRVLGQSRPTPDSSIRFEVWLPAPDRCNGRTRGSGTGATPERPSTPRWATR